MLKFYHSPGTRAFRAIWACEELGVPYEIEPVDFSPENRRKPEWRAMNPVGKVPVMDDGDIRIFESCAMVQYVLDIYGNGKLQPAKSDPSYAYFLQWLWFSESTFGRPLGEITNHRREFNPELPDVVAEMKARCTLCVQALDQALEGKDFLLGDDYSAVDFSIGYPLRGYRRSVSENLPANVQGYWQRLTALPSYERTAKADEKTKFLLTQ